jgi:hypothetical protein
MPIPIAQRTLSKWAHRNSTHLQATLPIPSMQFLLKATTIRLTRASGLQSANLILSASVPNLPEDIGSKGFEEQQFLDVVRKALGNRYPPILAGGPLTAIGLPCRTFLLISPSQSLWHGYWVIFRSS